jgi:hypothetical protein
MSLVATREWDGNVGARLLYKMIGWAQKLKEATITKNDVKIFIRINDQDIVINSRIQTMDTKAILKADRTFVPIRFVAEALGATVGWNNSTRTVIIIINKNIVGAKAEDFYKINPDMPKELYTYPYRKKYDGWYATNQFLVGKYGPKQIEGWMKIAKDYMENCYTVDYKTLNKDQFIEKVRWYFVNVSWFGNDGVRRSVDDHLKYWSDMVIEKKIVMKTQYITDKSLVVSNGNLIIRGRAVYRIDSCTDMDLLNGFLPFGGSGDLNNEHACDMEIELENLQGIDDWEHAPRVMYGEYFLKAIK